MKVILLKDIKNVGKKHQVVEVNDGYAKNYLCKQNLAVVATKESLSHLTNDLNILAKDHQKQIDQAQKLKVQIEQIQLTFHLKANNGQCFGKISRKHIIDALAKDHQIHITKYMFDPNFHNLKLGRYIVNLKLFENVSANLAISVIAN